MFPIRDHNPSLKTPYVTYALMAVNILVFLSYWGNLENPRIINQFFYDWAMVPKMVTSGDHYYTLISSMFLHGGFMHLAGNMLFLWIFGDNMEEQLGHIGYLLFYFAVGLAAGLTQILTAPHSPVPVVGASGAIAGVMGGYLLLFPKAKIDILFIFVVFFRIFPIPAWIMLGIWFGLQVLNGAIADSSIGGVAYWEHAGGFIAGILLTLPVWQRLGGKVFWDKTHGHPPHPEAKYKLTPSRIPKITRRR
ncbi:MAG TPA: rhomboid family intramembrane serine protease [Rhodobacteraceae bacterium]|nr:rhomboid family intramembrane serine protease [Paracoccaceae bacterium]